MQHARNPFTILRGSTAIDGRASRPAPASRGARRSRQEEIRFDRPIWNTGFSPATFTTFEKVMSSAWSTSTIAPDESFTFTKTTFFGRWPSAGNPFTKDNH
jgi:hypothetical protein